MISLTYRTTFMLTSRCHPFFLLALSLLSSSILLTSRGEKSFSMCLIYLAFMYGNFKKSKLYFHKNDNKENVCYCKEIKYHRPDPDAST